MGSCDTIEYNTRLQRYSAQREASHDLPQKQTTTEHNQDGELSTQDDHEHYNDFCSPYPQLQGLAILQYRVSSFLLQLIQF